MINGIRTGKYLSIGRAEARKSVVWQEDIAAIIPSLSKTGGTYNLTDGYHPSFKELEKVISSALKKRKPVTVPTVFARVLAMIGDFLGKRFPINTDKLNKITATLTFDDTRARKELGWNPSNVLLKLSKAL
jgi:nucleoside-diphosphate-sugar epimerase